MTAYINELIITLVVCQIASMITPESENAKRYIRVVCALVTILTLISPVRTLADHADEIMDTVGNFFGVSDDTAKSDETEADGTRERLDAAAYTILTYAGERYDLETDGAEVSFFTDEQGKVTELQIFLKSGSGADRDRLTAELEEELDVTVHIFIEERTDDG